MKILCLFKKNMKYLGVYAPKSIDNSKSYKLVLLLIFMLLFSMMTGIYLFCEAETLIEISDGINAVLSALGIFFAFGLFSWHSSNVFRLIEAIESAIQTRKF